MNEKENNKDEWNNFVADFKIIEKNLDEATEELLMKFRGMQVRDVKQTIRKLRFKTTNNTMLIDFLEEKLNTKINEQELII